MSSLEHLTNAETKGSLLLFLVAEVVLLSRCFLEDGEAVAAAAGGKGRRRLVDGDRAIIQDKWFLGIPGIFSQEKGTPEEATGAGGWNGDTDPCLSSGDAEGPRKGEEEEEDDDRDESDDGEGDSERVLREDEHLSVSREGEESILFMRGRERERGSENIQETKVLQQISRNKNNLTSNEGQINGIGAETGCCFSSK